MQISDALSEFYILQPVYSRGVIIVFLANGPGVARCDFDDANRFFFLDILILLDFHFLMCNRGKNPEL